VVGWSRDTHQERTKEYETQETAHHPRLGRRRLRPQHGHRLGRRECSDDQSPDNHCPLLQRVDEHCNAPVPEHGGFVRFLQLQRQHYRLKLSRQARPGRPSHRRDGRVSSPGQRGYLGAAGPAGCDPMLRSGPRRTRTPACTQNARQAPPPWPGEATPRTEVTRRFLLNAKPIDRTQMRYSGANVCPIPERRPSSVALFRLGSPTLRAGSLAFGRVV